LAYLAAVAAAAGVDSKPEVALVWLHPMAVVQFAAVAAGPAVVVRGTVHRVVPAAAAYAAVPFQMQDAPAAVAVAAVPLSLPLYRELHCLVP